MKENYLRKIIKKDITRHLVISLIVMIIAMIPLIAQNKILSTLYTPLTTLKSSEEIIDHYENNKVYANLENANIYFLDYGIYEYNTYHGVKTSEEKLSEIYGIIVYNDGFLLTLMPKNYLDMEESELNDVSTVCKLEDLENNEFTKEAYTEMIDIIAKTYDISAEDIEPIIPKICVTIPKNGRMNDQLLIAMASIIVLISAIVFILKLLTIIDYKKSKMYSGLSAYGDAENIEYAVNQSFDSADTLYKSKLRPTLNIGLINPNYIIARQGSSFQVFPSKDLIWAHMKVTKHRSYFITVRKTYQILMYFRDIKNPAFINFKEENMANDIIDKISKTLPVTCGYSKELEKTYKTSYQDFLKMADQYKTNFNLNKQQSEEQQDQQEQQEEFNL